MLVAFPAAASADFPQFRISNLGADGDLTQQGGFTAAAYNSTTNEFLVVFEGGASADDHHWAVYGQRVDAAGNKVGDPFPISLPTSEEICSYDPPNVAYSPAFNEWLVTWNQGVTDCDAAVRAQRVAADGTLTGDPSKLISAPNYTDIETTNPVFNSKSGEWMVEWKGRPPSDATAQELFAQRLDQNLSELGGTDDLQLTHFKAAGGNVNDATNVAVDTSTGRYLAVVRGNDAAFSARTEIYGHLMEADGTTVGADHFRISDIASTNAAGNAQPPNVVFDPSAGRFLVLWTADEMIGSMVDNEIDTFGRFVGNDGTVLGGADLRYSDMGPDGDTNFQAQRPRAGFNPNAKEFLITWSGDDDTAPQVDEESEVWGQRVASDGGEIGDNDFRISRDGPDGDVNFAANRPSPAYNSLTCQYLIAWQAGNVGNFGTATEEWDVYGNIVDTPCPPVNRTVPQITGTAQDGQTLTSSDGTWSGRGITFSYQWLRDGQPITGATQSTYVATAADVNHNVSSRVTATDPDGTAAAESAAVAPIAKPVIPVVTPPDKTAPVCTLAIAKQKIKTVIKKGLKARMSCNEAARVSGVLAVSKKVAKKLKLKSRTIGKGSGRITKSGKFTLTIKLTKKAKKALAKAKSVKVTAGTTATDTAGNRAKKRSKSVTLKK